MSDTISLKPEDVKRLVCTQRDIQFDKEIFKEISLVEIWELTQDVNKLASDLKCAAIFLEEHWEEFSASDHKFLVEVAYDFIDSGDSGSDQSSKSFIQKFLSQPVLSIQYFRSALNLFLRHRSRLPQIIFDHKQAKRNLEDAKYRIADTILNAVERDNLDYQGFLSDTLEEVEQLQDRASSPLPSLEQGEIDGWLQRLSNSAMD